MRVELSPNTFDHLVVGLPVFFALDDEIGLEGPDFLSNWGRKILGTF